MTLDEAKMIIRENQVRAPYMSFWRHKKTDGVYVVLRHIIIEATLEPAVVYRKLNADPAEAWCRPASEFFDGRFKMELAHV